MDSPHIRGGTFGPPQTWPPDTKLRKQMDPDGKFMTPALKVFVEEATKAWVSLPSSRRPVIDAWGILKPNTQKCLGRHRQCSGHAWAVLCGKCLWG